MPKILRHGTYGFTSPPKEVVLRNFIALENPSSSGLNPRILSPMAITQQLDHRGRLYTYDDSRAEVGETIFLESLIHTYKSPRHFYPDNQHRQGCFVDLPPIRRYAVEFYYKSVSLLACLLVYRC
jgi:hypothetical protein